MDQVLLKKSSTFSVFIYLVSFIDKWSVPIISGQRPPPCYYFTLNKLSHNRGIMFGGYNGNLVENNDIFIMELTYDAVVRY